MRALWCFLVGHAPTTTHSVTQFMDFQTGRWVTTDNERTYCRHCGREIHASVVPRPDPAEPDE